ncbi:phage tail protein [Mycobacterium sp. Y57]|uniref:phage tail protein n=1 Tax=Mycolicibacterium xanthum TaxID=2796469 RepID=UPI001C85DC56|nr:phage tail protein [Mycolicibacterium xanthum]MBX7432769.1 phage tail protein [Mycolicibacterium xanthum]
MADDAFVGVTFAVELDKMQVGRFSSCEGLGLEVVLEQREEGGNNGMVWQLPTRLKYSNIKLSRPIGPDSEKLTAWIIKALNGLEPTTGVISALDTEGRLVVEWSLEGVVPVRWTGPSLNLDSAKVFTETLEIAHHGFTPKAGG